MMAWVGKYNFPGCMFVPRKHHPFVNEWQTIYCSLSGIMFYMELVEGRDKRI